MRIIKRTKAIIIERVLIMAQCNKCGVHNEVHMGYEDEDEFLEAQCFQLFILYL